MTAPNSPGGGLPSTHDFTGRQQELSALLRDLDTAPLAVLQGMPGIGKTALAVQLARLLAAAKGLPVLWVQAREEGGLLERVDAALQAIGVQELTPYLARGELRSEERWMTLCALLRRRPAVLVLDDLHLLGALDAASLLSLLAAQLGPARAIATTRVRLEARFGPGSPAVEHIVGALDENDACALLRALLGARAPAAERHLHELAHALGCHPLSLRMAAGALQQEGITPLELLEQTSRYREDLDRALFDRLHASLALAERRLLAALSVFRGPAEPIAVARLVGPEVLELASKLAARFALDRLPDGRLDLHPLVRESARARLGAEDATRLHALLARWFEERATFEPAAGPGNLELLVEAHHHAACAGDDAHAYRLLLGFMDRLLLRGRHRELAPMLDRALATIYEPDLRVALTKARLLRDQGRPSEARQLLADMSGREDPRDRARLLAEQGLLEADAGRFDKALRLYYSALECARADADMALQAQLLSRIATLCKDRGEYDRAVRLFEQASDLETRHGTPGGAAWTLHNLAKIHYFQGEHDRALQAHSEALQVWESIGDRLSALLARNGIANILRDRGLVKQAEEAYERNLADYRALANPFGESYTLANLAHMRMTRGQNAAAEEMLAQSIALARNIGNRLGEALALDRLGDLRRLQGRTAEARVAYAEALAIKRPMRNDYGVSITLNCLGDLERESGAYAAAQAHYDEALELCRRTRDKDGTARALEGKAVILADRGELHAARAQFQEALDLRSQIDERRGVGRALSQLGHVAGQAGDVARAFEFYKEAMEVFTELDNRRELQRTLGCLAQLHANLDELDFAEELAAESLALARQLDDRRGEAIALTQLGRFALQAGRLEDAAARLEDSMRLRETLGDDRGVAACLEPLALARMEAGRLEEANALLARALELADHGGFQKLALLCRAHQALVALRVERLEDAERSLGALQDQADALGFAEGVAYCLRLRGYAACRRGAAEEGAGLLKRARELYRKLALGREISRVERELEEVGKDRLLGRLERRRGMAESSRRAERQLLDAQGEAAAAMVVDLDEPGAGLPSSIETDRRASFRDTDSPLARQLAAHGGRPVKVVGRSLLAVFPDAARALEAARFVRESDGRRRRVGLDAGRVLLVAGEAFGEPLGLACRFHGLATPGEIVATDAFIAALAAAPPDCQELPGQRVRGRAQPVRAFKLGA
ncbi:MAG: tetratricopeptide repeat protein [Candidatus Wallbacteria bacterium]|nr:tetratricopeptide repeat protein [Candidatus Wallbacteria bacterium]